MRNAYPIGYVFTVTTYGTWLHGDERGSHERKGNHRLRAPNYRLQLWGQSKLKYPPMTLGAEQRQVVRIAVEDDCEYRGDVLRALNVRTNHFHAVILTRDAATKVLNRIKAWATRKLREAGLVETERKVWTKGGGYHRLWDEDDVREACRYVLEGQGADLPEA